MAMTLAEARTDVLERLDDEAGRRYAPSSNYAKVDRALDVALSSCLDEYVSAGGDRFSEDVDVTTTAAGVADLSAYDPLHVSGVMLIPEGSTAYHPLQATDRQARGLPVTTAYDLRCVVVRRLAVPRDHSDQPLVGGSFAGARSWVAFDDWVIATAAQRLGTKDDELRQAIVKDLAERRANVLSSARTPRALAWPDSRRPQWATWRQLRWIYQHDQRAVTLYHSGTVV